MTHKHNAKSQYKKDKRIARLFGIALVVFALIALQYAVYPEVYMPTSRHQLEIGINNGDEEAIERYNSKYIMKDKYLFDDSVTIELCCKKYGLNIQHITEEFEQSEYTSFQEFFDNEIK